MRLMRIIIGMLLLMVLAGGAQAQTCNFSVTDVDFGSGTLTKGGNLTADGTLSGTCSGTPNQTITICANFGTGSGGALTGGSPRYMKNGVSQVEYDIVRDPGVGQLWGSWLWSNPDRPPNISVVLNASGNGTLSRVVPGRMSTNQPDALAGLHTSSFSGNNATIDFGYATSFACSSNLSSRAKQVTFTVKVNNVAGCTLNSTAMSFGTVTLMNAVKDATSTVNVTCTKNVRYDVGLNNGTGGGTGPTARRMKNASTTSYITYGIYRDAARTLPWGDVIGTNTVNARGNGRVQPYTAYGRIPVQSTPPGLTYTDTVTATVTY